MLASNSVPTLAFQDMLGEQLLPPIGFASRGNARTDGADNSLAARRRNRTGGPYGPDTCISGYVWREAVANDRVCVTPAVREQAARDNSQRQFRVVK